jgi:hypothetical protein
MLAAWWLAVVGLPVFTAPLPESPGEPASVAIAAGRASLRMPCYSLVCLDAEWSAPTRYTQLRRPTVPGTLPRLRPSRPSPLATRSYAHLYSPATRRDWVTQRGSNWRIDAGYGFEAIRSPETSLRLELATGYRLQPYVDYGTADVGPIARGRMQLSQSLGERAQLTQQVQVETGRSNTFVRQTIGVDVTLKPQWTLRSDVEMRHDTAANGGNGETDTEGSVKVRYAF